MNKRQVLIEDCWESPPDGVNVIDWLNEPIRIEININDLTLKRYILRFELIRAVRKSPRHKAEPVTVVRSI